jgi:hypothetical protein
MIKTTDVKLIQESDWNKLVSDTYGKIYNFQQQKGCQPRGFVKVTIPDENWEEDEMNDKIPEIINDEDKKGVKFDVWLKRDPNEPLKPSDEDLEKCNYFWEETEEGKLNWNQDKSHIDLFWKRNFYPCLQSVANDLHKNGLIESGNYLIEINW